MDLVLIPAYEPDRELINLAKRLKEENFAVLVVDDGSGENYKDIFEAVRENATVLTLEHNSGKGAALKTGMRYIRDHIPECENFITCDADGQHRVEDVKRVQKMLHKEEHFVLTVRYAKEKRPFRSRIGNSLSRFVYTLLADKFLPDNQSGLRGFNRIHIDWLIDVEKNNYDYEMNVLYYASKKNIRIATLPIEAIYIGNNESSHFNPIKDTIRIYKSLFYLARGTFYSLIVSELVILLASVFFGYRHPTVTIPTAAALAFFSEFMFNRYLCFRHTPCHNYTRSMISTIIEYALYTMDCLLLYTYTNLPLIASFNIVYVIFVPLRYLLHKLLWIASKTKE